MLCVLTRSALVGTHSIFISEKRKMQIHVFLSLEEQFISRFELTSTLSASVCLRQQKEIHEA